MGTDGVTKTFTNRGTSAPLAENVTKLAPMATAMMRFATVVAKFKSQEVAMMFICNVRKSAVEAEDVKHSLSEILMFWVMLNLPVCLWTRSYALDLVSSAIICVKGIGI